MIGDRLATARKKKGLTQIELAEALGGRYNQQMISHVERDRSTLRVDGLVNAAKVLTFPLTISWASLTTPHPPMTACP